MYTCKKEHNKIVNNNYLGIYCSNDNADNVDIYKVIIQNSMKAKQMSNKNGNLNKKSYTM